MTTQPNNYLLPELDGLITRQSHQYAEYKFKALETYLAIFNKSMRDKPWRNRYYIDLQAGPGKNHIGSQILLGSPLIALTANHPSTQFRFNELEDTNYQALHTRIAASPLQSQVKLYQADANVIVNTICAEIEQDDFHFVEGKWGTLNIAFLDPEGLELNWSTIERLAKIGKMDLIINFSTSGVLRSVGKNLDDKLDQFFGNQVWRKVDSKASPDQRRRDFINIYLSSLKKFGYHIEIDPSFRRGTIPVNNSKNVQIYSLIFASKNPLGQKFWNESAKLTLPPRLPGFD
jgi:three-Cys-motif partner protein